MVGRDDCVSDGRYDVIREGGIRCVETNLVKIHSSSNGFGDRGSVVLGLGGEMYDSVRDGSFSGTGERDDRVAVAASRVSVESMEATPISSVAVSNGTARVKDGDDFVYLNNKVIQLGLYSVSGLKALLLDQGVMSSIGLSASSKLKGTGLCMQEAHVVGDEINVMLGVAFTNLGRICVRRKALLVLMGCLVLVLRFL